MTDTTCDEMRLLVAADLDGELTAAETARVAAHLDACASCRAAQAELTRLSKRLHEDATRYRAPPALRARVTNALAASVPVTASPPPPWATRAAPYAGLALAACVAGLLFVTGPQVGTDVAGAAVAAHVRALQPGHLMDVVSTDQHTVRPWFAGRLPFAPPVKDLAGAGFPLAGARLDYFDGRTAAAMVYRHGPHVIDLFAWPTAVAPSGPTSERREGYRITRWTDDGIALAAVSDTGAEELADFVRRWRETPG